MSFLYFRPYLSVVDSARCPISVYSRFLIALFVLGIGLTASVIIKEFPQKQSAPEPLNIGEAADDVKGSLEAFPRDFELNPMDPIGMNIVPTRLVGQDSQKQPYMVGKKPAEMPDLMGKKYPESVTASDNDERPSLDVRPALPSLPANYRTMPEKELLKHGYIRHRTINGDYLNGLAEKFLHDPERWVEIYELNRSVLTNKDVIPIGIVLIIPAQ